jgi:hypothetical protein
LSGESNDCAVKKTIADCQIFEGDHLPPAYAEVLRILAITHLDRCYMVVYGRRLQSAEPTDGEDIVEGEMERGRRVLVPDLEGLEDDEGAEFWDACDIMCKCSAFRRDGGGRAIFEMGVSSRGLVDQPDVGEEEGEMEPHMPFDDIFGGGI